jgi:hypothetical protein
MKAFQAELPNGTCPCLHTGILEKLDVDKKA